MMVKLDDIFNNIKPAEPFRHPKTQPLPGRTPNPDIQIYHGDFNIIGQQIPDESIDCIITDPMYYRAMLHTWDELGALAKRVLKPSGFCVGYSGQFYIKEVLKNMDKHLEYYHLMCLRMNGTIETLRNNMMQRWKPLVVYQKPPEKLVTPVEDVIVNELREKTHYPWQQGVQGWKSLVEIFSKPGDLVLDPMMGAGTSAIACYRSKRKSIGIEIQPVDIHNPQCENTFEIAYQRIQKETGQEPVVYRQENIQARRGGALVEETEGD